jgi:hypothetical protein
LRLYFGAGKWFLITEISFNSGIVVCWLYLELEADNVIIAL